jgi:hypothetical protein
MQQSTAMLVEVPVHATLKRSRNIFKTNNIKREGRLDKVSFNQNT